MYHPSVSSLLIQPDSTQRGVYLTLALLIFFFLRVLAKFVQSSFFLFFFLGVFELSLRYFPLPH